MNILVLAPMQSEADYFKSALRSKGNLHNRYKLVCCGVGKVEAASTAALEVYSTSFPVDLVAVIGFAAGSTDFEQGDIVIPGSTRFHDIKVPEGFLQHMTKEFQLQGPDGTVCLTGDSFVDASLADELTSKFGTDVIFDMECSAISQVCEEPGIPVLQIKMISDIPQKQGLVDFNSFVETHTDFSVFLNFLETI